MALIRRDMVGGARGGRFEPDKVMLEVGNIVSVI